MDVPRPCALLRDRESRRRHGAGAADRFRRGVSGLGRAAAGQARTAAPGLPAGRPGALLAAPGHAAQPQAQVLPGRGRRCGEAPHRGRSARRHRSRDEALRRACSPRSGSRSATSPTPRCWKRWSENAACRPSALEQSLSQTVQERYEDYTQQAIDAKVFGAPSYVIDGEIFWGQDRLDFVERALKQQQQQQQSPSIQGA